ncbi:MAG: domain protein beta Propeller [Pedosphaera sp.]|nr:domain protein beta Propeller [Pedosphaera sp.]
MKHRNFFIIATVAACLTSLCATDLRAQDNDIEIKREGKFLGLTPPTPIAITGFSGEVAAALKFDLTVMGFIDVAPEAAKYVLSGANNGNVQGQLSFGKTVLFSKAYSGASARAQAHHLADDVVLKVTGVNGIAHTQIAFKVDTGAHSEIYLADFDGWNPQAVTRDNTIVAAPCWVPQRLAMYYTSYKMGAPFIFYQNLSTGERRNFAHYPGGMNSSAAVSPDGKKVAMILATSGSPDVYVCDADGNNLKDLTPTREDESSPCWSPDGQWICFASKVNERRSLCKVSVNGGPTLRIPTSGVSNPSEPDWSPDGNWIVFTAQMGGFEICVVPAKGGIAIPLVAGEDPCWAPNSRNVIFARRSGENRVLSLLDVPTKQVKDASRVSGRNAGNSQPSWAR